VTLTPDNGTAYLAGMVSTIAPVVKQRVGELKRVEISAQNLSEYAALVSLEQMASLAHAVSILEQHEALDTETLTPATALGRIGVEGLIYTNYLIADDVEFRAGKPGTVTYLALPSRPVHSGLTIEDLRIDGSGGVKELSSRKRGTLPNF